MIKSDDSKMPELLAALAAAQGQFRPVVKDKRAIIKPREKPAYEFWFASFPELIDATRPALAANGLAIVQPVTDEGGTVYLYTILSHASGAALVTRILVPGPDPAVDFKVYGGELAYLRRYHYAGILCLAADDDSDTDGTDGIGGDEGAPEPRKTPARKPAAPAPAGEPIPGIVGAGERKWLETKIAALQLPAETRAAMMTRHGVTDEAAMTMTQFAAISSELRKL